MLPSETQLVYAPALAEMHRQCFEDPWSLDSFQSLLALSTTKCWVSERGFLLCSKVLDEMEILTIGVLPMFRRQHVASHLLHDLFSYAQTEKVQSIFLEVSEKNQPAQKLYTALGFLQIGRRKEYYQTKQGPVDALWLRKVL